MTTRSVTHSTFSLERVYPASPHKVFDAFADPKKKAQWFGGPDDWQTLESEFEFQVGGRELNSSRSPEGTVIDFDVRYQDIVEDSRIVYTYDMRMDGKRLSVSVATIVLAAEGNSTRLTITEQGAFLDGLDDPKMREQGTIELVEGLGRFLESEG